jgi:hypothetical protein
MYRTLSDRQSGNMYGQSISLSSMIATSNPFFLLTTFTHTHTECRLDFWETSRDETTGEIRFRRQTQFVNRAESRQDNSAASTALPMGRLVRTQPQVEERYVERFEAREIELEDDESVPDKKRGMAIEDDKSDKSATGWVHAK